MIATRQRRQQEHPDAQLRPQLQAVCTGQRRTSSTPPRRFQLSASERMTRRPARSASAITTSRPRNTASSYTPGSTCGQAAMGCEQSVRRAARHERRGARCGCPAPACCTCSQWHATAQPARCGQGVQLAWAMHAINSQVLPGLLPGWLTYSSVQSTSSSSFIAGNPALPCL